MAAPAAVPKILCVVTLNGETTQHWTNQLVLWRAEKALGKSIPYSLRDGEFGAIAALCYAAHTSGDGGALLKLAGGNHAKALELWLEQDPGFSIDLDAVPEDADPKDETTPSPS